MTNQSTAMISPRTFTLATRTGHTLRFEADVERSVPSVVVPDALANGVRLVDADAIPEQFMDTRSVRVDFSMDMRQSLLHIVVAGIAERNNLKDFDAANMPKLGLVNERLGFDVTPKELRAAYDRYKELLATGAEPELDPKAAAALNVLQAESVAELMLLAEELGEDAKALRKLGSPREIRRKLLSRFTPSVGA